MSSRLRKDELTAHTGAENSVASHTVHANSAIDFTAEAGVHLQNATTVATPRIRVGLAPWTVGVFVAVLAVEAKTTAAAKLSRLPEIAIRRDVVVLGRLNVVQARVETSVTTYLSTELIG